MWSNYVLFCVPTSSLLFCYVGHRLLHWRRRRRWYNISHRVYRDCMLRSRTQNRRQQHLVSCGHFLLQFVFWSSESYFVSVQFVCLLLYFLCVYINKTESAEKSQIYSTFNCLMDQNSRWKSQSGSVCVPTGLTNPEWEYHRHYYKHFSNSAVIVKNSNVL